MCIMYIYYSAVCFRVLDTKDLCHEKLASLGDEVL